MKYSSLPLLWIIHTLYPPVCLSCLHTFLGRLYCKQYGPRSDCSLKSSLIWVHTVCHRGYLKHFSRREKQTTFVAIGPLRVNFSYQMSSLSSAVVPSTKWALVKCSLDCFVEARSGDTGSKVFIFGGI